MDIKILKPSEITRVVGGELYSCGCCEDFSCSSCIMEIKKYSSAKLCVRACNYYNGIAYVLFNAVCAKKNHYLL